MDHQNEELQTHLHFAERLLVDGDEVLTRVRVHRKTHEARGGLAHSHAQHSRRPHDDSIGVALE
jgi:hypothetical protein